MAYIDPPFPDDPALGPNGWALGPEATFPQMQDFFLTGGAKVTDASSIYFGPYSNEVYQTFRTTGLTPPGIDLSQYGTIRLDSGRTMVPPIVIGDDPNAPPPSLLDQVKRIAMGSDNLDMTLDEFLLHVQTKDQEYFVARLKEYEAMLYTLGLLAGVIPGKSAETEALREALGDALSAWYDSLPRLGDDYAGVPDGGTVIVAGIVGWFDEEAADRMIENSAAANRIQVQANMMMGQMLLDLISGIWQALTDWWNEFWEIYDREGLFVAMNRLKVDLAFFAAECAIDVAISAALIEVGGPLIAGALRALRIVGRRTVGSAITKVTIKAIPDDIPMPNAHHLLDIDVSDADIPPNIDRILDEDKFGGISELEDIANRLKADPENNRTTTIDGGTQGKPKPQISGNTVSPDEWRALRAETPSDELRVEINQGHPVASEANPVPDEWLPGLERTAPYSPDHIVPASRIRDMEGFADLTYDQQVALLNYKPNFHPMSRAANTSRGNRRFSEWTEHKRTGTQVNPALREAMIPREEALEKEIQEIIYELLRQNQAGTGNPFRN